MYNRIKLETECVKNREREKQKNREGDSDTER